MQTKTIATILATAAVGVSAQNETATGKLGDALVVSNNPPGVVYVATLPEVAWTKGSAYADGGNAKGHVSAVASPDGVGVMFTVHFSNLPKEGGPFKYHLHVAPVPENGNCTATLAHLDPFLRGENPPCDSSAPEKCEVGDLSGKWGEVKSDPFTATYTDKYASTFEGIGAFFGNRSLVFHYANKTRITCANFKKVTGGSGGSQPPKPDADDCTSTTAMAASSTMATSALATLSPTIPSNTTGLPATSPTMPVAAGAALPGMATAAGAVAMLAAVALNI
ncbi:hypothetical protein RB594_005806 [Gaeumannomyces avenae]